MINKISRLGRFEEDNYSQMGRKAVNLDWLIKKGYMVPSGICLSSAIYDLFLDQSGLGTWLSLNVEKKPFENMRWEEIWDLSLAIRHRFLKTPFPDTMQTMLLDVLEPFSHISVVVRSSSLNEDSGEFSFAGLHDSLVDVQGMYSILEAIKEVWSSLWSDRALVYSNRFGLNLQDSSMAVIVQELIPGKCSGVLFTESFQNRKQAVIETVSGLNEDLVSGKVKPDRIVVEVGTGKIVDWERADPLSVPFITDNLVSKILNAGFSLEKEFKMPLDMEWTIADEELVLLQVRPITSEREEDQKSFDELMILKDRMIEEFLPQMQSLAHDLSKLDVNGLDRESLESELQRRQNLKEQWEQTYIDMFIPLAHGVRIFGQVYNKVVMPESPFEFIELLVHDDLNSLKRNREMLKLARLYHEQNTIPENELDQFIKDYGQTSFFGELLFPDREKLIHLIRNFTTQPSEVNESEIDTKRDNLEALFLRSMTALGRSDGEDLLELARVSYKLRDDDNIAVSKIYGECLRVENELKNRFEKSSSKRENREQSPENLIKKRQVTGACASPGLAKGRARVIKSAEDLFKTQKGEILVCDSIDPNITFIIPLVSAIVERRGGMLVHGAIIAREYGIPCITGVEYASEIIENGDMVTVDAYSGIVTIHLN